MPLYSLIILALVQGLTEFLPVSSSGHLVLAHEILNGTGGAANNDSLMLDVAVHVGTLLSVLVYFRGDVLSMLAGLKDWAAGNRNSEGARLDACVFLASLPVIAAGLGLYLLNPSWLRSVEILGWTTLFFGILLWWADAKYPANKSLKDLNIHDAVLIGLAQALALVPGTSRSGITMTAGRMLGYSRSESAHFSLLLAIVAIAGAGVIGVFQLIKTGNAALGFEALIACALAFLSGWAAIALMMKWLERSDFTPFALYRIVLGLALLIAVYGGFLS